MNFKIGQNLKFEGSFTRFLLSSYYTPYKLDNYINYFKLKEIVNLIEAVQNKICALGGPKNSLSNTNLCSTSYSSISIPNLNDSPFNTSNVNTVNSNSRRKTPLEERERVQTGISSPIQGRKLEFPLSIEDVDDLVFEQEKLIKSFFDEIKISHKKVCAFFQMKEKEISNFISKILSHSKAELVEILLKKNSDAIPVLYCQIRNIAFFFDINIIGFKKILSKFFCRCAMNQLKLQEKVHAADDIIYHSAINNPTIDHDSAMDKLAVVYAIINELTFELAKKRLDLFLERDLLAVNRIVSPDSCYFYVRYYSSCRPPERYSIQIVPCLTAQNLTKKLCKSIKYPVTCSNSFAYPNGEICVLLRESVRGNDTYVVQSMAGTKKQSMSGSIMELVLAIQTLMLASASRITAVIPYISYCHDPNAISAVAEMLMINGCKQVLTVDLTRPQVEGMFGNLPVHNVTAMMEFIHYITNRLRVEERDVTNIVVVSSDSDNVAFPRQFADNFSDYLNKQIFGSDRCPTGTVAPTPQYVNNLSTSEGQYGEQRNERSFNLDGQNAFTTSGSSAGSSVTSPSLQTGAYLDKEHLTPKFTTVFPLSLPMLTLNKDPQPEDNLATNKNFLPSCSSTNTTENFHRNLGRQFSDFGSKNNNSCSSVNLSNKIFIPVVTAIKRPNKKEIIVDVIGEVKGKSCYIVDTMIDEAINAYQVAKALKRNGATKVTAVATHALFSGKAFELISEADIIDEVIITDSIDNEYCLEFPGVANKLRIISLAPLLGIAIKKIHTDNCLSILFDR